MTSPVRFLQLSDGFNFAIVDNDIYPELRKRAWSLAGRGYATSSINKEPVYMHRLVVAAPRGFVVDHINGNRLDNRRKNLRIATVGQNNTNRRDGKRVSRFRGVARTREGTWAAQTRYQGKRVRKVFKDEESAARQYDVWAKASFGEFARLNFPV